jgi:hypothetical protein
MAALVQIVEIINVFARTTELQEETHHTTKERRQKNKRGQ